MLISLAERRGPRPLWLLGVLAAAGAARTATRVPVWNDTESVMGALIQDHPESGTGWMNLGRQLAAQGRQEDALTAFTYAVVFLNSGYRPSTELAAHLTAMNRPAAARFFLMRAWREHPEWYTAPGLLAAAELRAGRPEKTAPAARAAAFLQPSNPSMHHLLAQSLAGLEAWDGAVDARLRSLRTGFSDRGRSWLSWPTIRPAGAIRWRLLRRSIQRRRVTSPMASEPRSSSCVTPSRGPDPNRASRAPTSDLSPSPAGDPSSRSGESVWPVTG